MLDRKPIVHIPDEYLPGIEELPGNLRKIAEAIEEVLPGEAVRITLILAQRFVAIPLYFRSAEPFLAAYRDKRMRNEYDRGGITALDLALKTGIGLRQVQRILSRPDNQAELEDKQLRLF